MKKWLIGCLTVLAMVCLIPGIVLKAAAETVPVHCAFCGIREEREARRYEKYDSTYHRVYVTECQNCHNDGNITHLQVHSGGTQGPTCTEGKICKKCGAEYGVLGHDWGAYAGIIVGGVVDLVWAQLSGGIFDLYEIVPGFVFGLLAIVVVSLLTPEPSKEIQDEFDKVAAIK